MTLEELIKNRVMDLTIRRIEFEKDLHEMNSELALTTDDYMTKYLTERIVAKQKQISKVKKMLKHNCDLLINLDKEHEFQLEN